jgi:gliding motility-associated-like protein
MKIAALFLFVFLLLGSSVFSQSEIFNSTQQKGCGSDAFSEILRKDATYLKQEQLQNLALSKRAQARQNRTIQKKVTSLNDANLILMNPAPVPKVLTDMVIPIVFHIISDNPDAITDQMIFDALVQLNDAFGHRNLYGVDTLGTDTHIQFCLAKRTPAGGKTNGIDRVKSYYQDVDVDLESGELAKLTVWDQTKYANVWLVNSIKGEIPPTVFECGNWTRVGYGGYASAGFGAVVSGLSAPLVAHELGHYLSLLHTFQGQNCLNNDCTTDGDMVCDTPPDRSTKPSSCTAPENSCGTDLLSGPFTKDMADNVTNFMDYGSCPSVFTQGQAERMQDFVTIFSGGNLLTSNGCSELCADNISATFNWDGNPYPETGSKVEFNNTSSGSTDFEWYVNGTLEANTHEFEKTFATTGSYAVKLLAYNATKSCYASYTGNVIVNCGVDARFSPSKRIIASSSTIYQDTVTFVNTSYNAVTYQWFMTDSTGNNFSMVSTAKDLPYTFLSPGNYRIYLTASKAACTDISSTYTLRVDNPKQDPSLAIWSVNCYKTDSIRVFFSVLNNGYDTIPAGVSVKFYDQIPYNNSLTALKNTFYTPNYIVGKCSQSYTAIIATSRAQLDSILGYVNQENPGVELNPNNNQTAYRNFRFKYAVYPSNDTTVYINDLINLKIKSTGEPMSTIQWISNGALSCFSCMSPSFTIADTTTIKTIAKTTYDCYDSTFGRINIFPIDISIANNRIDCYKDDSLLVRSTICLGNHYTAFKKPITIKFYDAIDTLASTTNVLGDFILPVSTSFNNSCTTIEQIIKKTSTGFVSYYINQDQNQFEQVLTNNHASSLYIPFQISSSTNSFDLYRREPIQIHVDHFGDSVVSLKWTPNIGLSCDSCFDVTVSTNVNTYYQLKAKTLYDCTDSAGVNINVYYQKSLALPNVFTPNGDGLNDYFYVIAGKDVSKVREFVIFNRWGRKVFEKKNIIPNSYSGGWDGTTNGQQAEMGTYVYNVTLEFLDGSIKNYNGTISLIR